MTLAIGNQGNVPLTYTVQTGQPLALFHRGEALAPYGNKLFVELQAPPKPPTCTLTIEDAPGGNVHVWTVDASGALTSWTRAREGASLTVEALDHDVLVVHVPTGTTPPGTPSPSGPPAPGTSQLVVRVKVKDQGSLPLGST